MTLLTVVILTAIWGLVLSAMPRETLAVIISLLWMVPGGVFVLGTWIGYLGALEGAPETAEKVVGLFLKDPDK